MTALCANCGNIVQGVEVSTDAETPWFFSCDCGAAWSRPPADNSRDLEEP